MMNVGNRQAANDLGERTKKFALRIVRPYASLPKTTVAQVLGKQLLRSGTSLGAHYREASRARSRAEFVSKIESGLQELEEVMYWMELLRESDIVSGERFEDVNGEAKELLAVLVASVKTAKRNA
ncbi:MAG: four helix bundle protein [Nitrospirota bacterium]|nr:four helix bundle protein [Nitrospirota bacterium]